MGTQDLSDRLDHVKRELVALLRQLPRKRAKTIKYALELLDYFELLQWSVDELWDDLARNKAGHLKDLSRFPDDKPSCDLVAAILALAAVITFLRFSPGQPTIEERRADFKILAELRQALFDLSEGSAPVPMLQPQSKNRGRRADVSYVLGLKGS